MATLHNSCYPADNQINQGLPNITLLYFDLLFLQRLLRQVDYTQGLCLRVHQSTCMVLQFGSFSLYCNLSSQNGVMAMIAVAILLTTKLMTLYQLTVDYCSVLFAKMLRQMEGIERRCKQVSTPIVNAVSPYLR